jgi:hypothetical protein
MDRPARVQLRQRWRSLPRLQSAHVGRTTATAEGFEPDEDR